MGKFFIYSLLASIIVGAAVGWHELIFESEVTVHDYELIEKLVPNEVIKPFLEDDNKLSKREFRELLDMSTSIRKSKIKETILNN